MTLNLRLPLRIRALEESFGIDDAAGTILLYVYFDDSKDPETRSARKRMTREQAEAVAKVTARALTAAIEAEA